MNVCSDSAAKGILVTDGDGWVSKCGSSSRRNGGGGRVVSELASFILSF